MRALLILLAGCWSSPTSATAPKPAAPAKREPPMLGVKTRVGKPMEPLPAGLVVDAQMQLTAPTPPWTTIESGHLGPKWHVLHLATGGKDYFLTLGRGEHDGVLFPMLHQRDIVPGGPLEVIAEIILNDAGGSSSLVAVCGLGKSRVPSCAIYDAVHQPDEELEIELPRSGGVHFVTSEKTTKLWFEFP